MQSLLCAIGIGASEALPLAATLNWVIKDGLGQLGGVIFASVVRYTTPCCATLHYTTLNHIILVVVAYEYFFLLSSLICI